MIQKSTFEKFFAPRSVAVVGASDAPNKVGNMIARNLLEHKYAGDVFFVNPGRKTVLGRTSFASISNISTDVDCAVIAVPADLIYDVINDAKEKCKNFIVISAGFGETGAAGHNREMQLHELAAQHDLVIMGPNCLGCIVPGITMNMSFAPGMPAHGSIAFISQSGALAVAAMDKAQEENVGFSAVVSIGNEMMVTAADLIHYFADDELTRTIALYLEGVRDGKAFTEALRYAKEKNKTILILKSGQTDVGQRAIALHTGALAGSDKIFRAAVKKNGGISVNSMQELFVAMTFVSHYESHYEKPVRTGVVTNAGGPGVLITDTIAALKHLHMSTLTQRTKKTLFENLPHAASVHNPVDVLGDADTKRYDVSMRSVCEDKNTDLMIVLLTPQGQTPIMDIARAIVAIKEDTSIPMIVSFIGGTRVSEAIAFLKSNGVIHYDSVQDALVTLDRLFTMNVLYEYPRVRKLAGNRRHHVQKILLPITQRTSLYYEECVSLAKMYNIPISIFYDVTKGLSAQQRISYPCVAKIDDPQVLHKTDRGGVILPIRSLTELYRARAHLLRAFPSKSARVIVQPLKSVKMELIIGVKRDPIFGVVAIVGLGGVYTEVFQKTELFIAPLSLVEIKKILMNGTLGFLFVKTRGMHAYHLDDLAQCVLRMVLIVQENPEVQAIDINPFLVYNSDMSDVAVDFKVIIKK